MVRGDRNTGSVPPILVFCVVDTGFPMWLVPKKRLQGSEGDQLSLQMTSVTHCKVLSKGSNACETLGYSKHQMLPIGTWGHARHKMGSKYLLGE